jgi:molecular chaperone HscB
MVDYFKLLEMPLSFRPDLAELKRQYYMLIRSYHPDHFADMDDQGSQSSEINIAYKVLSDDQARWSYLLHFLGVLKDGEHEVLSQEFLMEIMEINEAIFDLETDFDEDKRNETLKEVEVMKADLIAALNKGIDLFENQVDKEDALKIIKENFLKLKYMLRIQENLSTFASL